MRPKVNMNRHLFSFKAFVALLGITGSLQGCSSLPEVRTQAYAQLKSEKTFETDFESTWKAIESALRLNTITSRNPSEVTPLEFSQLPQRTLQTDWVFSRSRTKYIAYQVDGFPRKTYLQTRFKYQILAERLLGGIKVRVMTQEEIERLDARGNPVGYTQIGEPDSSLASDLIEKISQELRSAP